MPTTILHTTTTFLYGIIIGSFLNVCIQRIPNKQSILSDSHCPNCNEKIRRYDLIPLFSYIILWGKCRHCKYPISIQYPIIELLNGILYLLIYTQCGLNIRSILYALCTSALITLSVIDFRTYEIPPSINIFILILGIIGLINNREDYITYIIGLFAISSFLLLIYLITKGRGVGGGDIKLMAVAGLLIGWKLIITAFVLGCVLGSVIHIIRIKISKVSHVLAFGPYLSMGILIAMLWGNQIIEKYLELYY